MPKNRRWECDLIKLKFHKVEDSDFKNLLAELWEVLLNNRCQLDRSQVLVPVKSQSLLLNYKRRVR